MKLQNHLIILIIITGFSINLFSNGFSFNYIENENRLVLDALQPIIADHTVVNYIRYDAIPEDAINNSKNTLHIAYAHTSHGSQIITGMDALPAYKEYNNGTIGLYNWNEGGTDGALDIDDYFVSGDLGNPDRTTWASLTRDYLDEPTNDDVNVVMWSWCGEVSDATEADIDTYLSLMAALEEDYPDIQFVYMTGHLDGTGIEGNLHQRNEQIRDFCNTNNKILFDFADIESYNPDGTYFGDKYATDNCDYDANEDGNPWNDGANWALEWQDDHPGEWYNCDPAHTQALNGNLKAYAAWWLWARLAGWSDENITPTPTYTPSTPPYTPTANGMYIGGLVSLSIVMLVAFTVIASVERRKKFMKK
ncbi:MAG: hypothetical protein ACFFDW_11055 [Candidatus Thorarchaeota archaeon]